LTRIEAEVQIQNQKGLHLRAAAAVAKLAESYRSEVSMLRDGVCANGKSIISLLTLMAARGTRVRVVAEGDDAREAVDALTDLITRKFGESE